jgi:hypothetical protein
MQAKKSGKLSDFDLLDSTEKELQSIIDGQTGKLTTAYFKKG